MSDKLINLKVITPTGILFEGEAKSFIVKTRSEVGDFAVLPDHIPMTSVIGMGHVRIELPDGTEQSATLFDGYCVVQNNTAVIIAEAGERPEDIDPVRAEAAKKRAEEYLRQPNLDQKRAELALYRSIVRLELYKDNGQKPQ